MIPAGDERKDAFVSLVVFAQMQSKLMDADQLVYFLAVYVCIYLDLNRINFIAALFFYSTEVLLYKVRSVRIWAGTQSL